MEKDVTHMCVYIVTHMCVYIHTHMCYIFFIHSSVDGHLLVGCFHVLAIINSAAMNIELHVSPRTHSFVCPSICICIPCFCSSMDTNRASPCRDPLLKCQRPSCGKEALDRD